MCLFCDVEYEFRCSLVRAGKFKFRSVQFKSVCKI